MSELSIELHNWLLDQIGCLRVVPTRRLSNDPILTRTSEVLLIIAQSGHNRVWVLE